MSLSFQASCISFTFVFVGHVLKYHLRLAVNEEATGGHLCVGGSGGTGAVEASDAPVKFIILSLALLGCVLADVSELGGYDYHAPAATEVHGDFGGEAGYSSSVPVAAAPANTYIPPAASAPASTYIPPAAPAPAPSAPVNTYIPPAASAPANTYIPPAASAPAPSVEVAEDGYRYKTLRRRVYRQRV
ncbi:vitelline membrane protein Vm26Ab-like [Musca domestica]|uniref:Vitelline membrane protein Vm26Ab-like n=1 Tax=Musca domestica TaxID=7370 RepID=A0ABM3VC89_MUSDO|nr:vitelline membrane protein Vm26Ab-like [Musca domestica]